MKRFAILMALVLLVTSLAAGALAATDFAYSGSQTSTMVAWSDPAQSSGTRWHMTWDMKKSNVSSSCRAVVRIYAGPGVYASSLYVYSSGSSSYHDYNDGYGEGQSNTYVGGRKDDRDAGTLEAYGKFYN